MFKAKVGAMRIELTCTPNRQSPLYPVPNEGLPRAAFATAVRTNELIAGR